MSRPEALEQTTTVDLGGVPESCGIDAMDCADELREEIATVRADHDHEAVVENPPFWLLEVAWNDARDEIEVTAFGIHSSYSVRDGESA